MARQAMSFSDLQRELIARQMEQRRARAREAAVASQRLVDDTASVRSAPALTILEG